MNRPTLAACAWMVLAGGIITYEAAVPPQQLLSAEADRWIEKHPISARVAILLAGSILTLHVANCVPQPERFDVMSTAFWKQFSRN